MDITDNIDVRIYDRIVVKVGKYIFEQLSRDLYRVHKDGIIIKECSNAVEAKQFLIESFSTDFDRYIAEKFEAQGINPYNGEIEETEVSTK